MNIADRIGLPPFLGWFVSGPGAATLIAWAFTPVGVYLVAYLFESRLVGRDFHPWKGAFRGFSPGDWFLGASFGQFVWQLDNHDSGAGWWCKWWWHIAVGVGAIVVSLYIRNKMDRPNYDEAAMNSPTKLYHDFVIYMGFGYVFFTTAVAASCSIGWDSTLILPYGLLAGWLAGLVSDGKQPKEQLKIMAANSHPTVWRPCWSRRALR